MISAIQSEKKTFPGDLNLLETFMLIVFVRYTLREKKQQTIRMRPPELLQIISKTTIY